MTTTILSHALLGALLVALVGAVLSTLWYAIRANVWPGLATAKLPLWARITQGVVEGLTNLPGAVRAVVGSSTPPGSPQPPAPPSSGQSGSTVGAVLVVVIAAVVTFLLALGLSVSGCDPSQHDPARYGTVSVYVSTDWSPTDRGRIGNELRALQALGPAFVTTDLSDQADVIVRPWDSPDCATAGAGGHTLGTRIAEVDPTCAPGDGAFRAFIGHEIGHALGMLHVCGHHESGPDCSPTVRGAPAMMARSPFVDSGDPVIGLVAVDTPQALDLAEYTRVRGGR